MTRRGLVASTLASSRNATCLGAAQFGRFRLTIATHTSHRLSISHYHTNAIKYKTIPHKTCNTVQDSARRLSSTYSDAANPEPSTRPPVFVKPQRGSASLPAHLWTQAKAYGSFYRTGIKAIIANRKLAKQLRKELEEKTGFKPQQGLLPSSDNALIHAAASRQCITRADFQLLNRNAHDMRRVPLFVVLVALLGEWLPLILPFAPYIQPLTCRLPDVVTGMRRKTEERRQTVFRDAVQEPKLGATTVAYDLIDSNAATNLVRSLNQDQLYHISAALNLHGRIWERISARPPSFLLTSRISSRLSYLAQDDALLLLAGGAKKLVSDELRIACEERGLDVVSPSDQQLQKDLSMWLQKQNASKGQAMLPMLFRRPRMWAGINVSSRQ